MQHVAKAAVTSETPGEEAQKHRTLARQLMPQLEAAISAHQSTNDVKDSYKPRGLNKLRRMHQWADGLRQKDQEELALRGQ